MIIEIKGRCPLCPSIGTAMQDYGKSLVCDYKQYDFPYAFYYCHRHGIFVWRKNKHKLFDLNKRINQVNNIKQLESEVSKRYEYMPTLADYKIIEMQCPYCKGKWKQHDGFLVDRKETVLCPFCESKIPKEKAKKTKANYL